MALLLILIGGLILTVGDIFQKQWVVTGKTSNFWIGILVWILGSICLALSFKEKNIAVASIMFVIFNVLSMSLISWLWYKEPLTPTQICAMILATVSVIILELK